MTCIKMSQYYRLLLGTRFFINLQTVDICKVSIELDVNATTQARSFRSRDIRISDIYSVNTNYES